MSRLADSASGSPGSLWPMASAYFMTSRILQTAVRLGVFANLAAGPRDVKSLARQCHADENSIEALLTACVALGLLERSAAGLYRNSQPTERMLVPGRPEYYGDVIDGMSAVYEQWAHLEEAVRSGRPVSQPSHRRGGESLRSYLLGVHNSSQQQAPLLVSGVDLDGRSKLLDVGGGLGTYSIALCRRWPDLTAVVLDLPQVVPFAREAVSREGLADRITVRGGDYRAQSFTEANDVVLLANVLQHEPQAVRASLLRKARKSLVAGGLVLVHDAMLVPERTGPMPVALGGLNNLIHGGGGCYSSADLLDWLRAAEFAEERVEWQSDSGLALGIGKAPS